MGNNEVLNEHIKESRKKARRLERANFMAVSAGLIQCVNVGIEVLRGHPNTARVASSIVSIVLAGATASITGHMSEQEEWNATSLAADLVPEISKRPETNPE